MRQKSCWLCSEKSRYSGPFTTRIASAAGVMPQDLTLLRREGLLRTPIKGVHVAAQVPIAIRRKRRHGTTRISRKWGNATVSSSASHSTMCSSVTVPSACRARSSANPSARRADGEIIADDARELEIEIHPGRLRVLA